MFGKLFLYSIIIACAVSISVQFYRMHKVALGTFWMAGATLWTLLVVAGSITGFIV